jgi:hypothetical protein
MPTSFENIVETNDVALNIHIRVINAITYSCLSCEVHDNVKLVFLEQFVDQFPICYATFDEMIVKSGERRVKSGELIKTELFETGVIVVIEIIYTHNRAFLHLLEETLYEVCSYKSGTAGNQYGHTLLFYRIRK